MVFYHAKLLSQHGRMIRAPFTSATARSNRLYRQADIPCSALCVNCLQLSCCIPRLSLDDFQRWNCEEPIDFTTLTSSWMSYLPQDTALRDLIMPGTHDSASYTISAWKPGSAVARTQNFSIHEQLVAGARYLDVRVAASTVAPHEISIWHGCLEGSHLQEILEQICEYCQEHTSEFIIVEIVPEYARHFPSELKLRALEMVHNALGDICIQEDPRIVLQTWKVGDIARKQTKLLVLLHERFYEDNDILDPTQVQEMYGFHTSQNWMRSTWHNTGCIETLKKSLLDDVKTNGRRKHQGWFCSQMILTPGVPTVLHLLQALVGRNSLRPVSLACKLYDHIGILMRDHADEEWNVISLDFFDVGADFVHFLISLNVPCEIEICLAVLETKGKLSDVTTIIQDRVALDRVLYLSGAADVGAICGDMITIAYKVGDEYAMVSCPVESGQSIVLGKFCSSHARTTVEKGTSGYFYNGKINQEKSSNAPTCVFRFLHDGIKCVFEVV